MSSDADQITVADERLTSLRLDGGRLEVVGRDLSVEIGGGTVKVGSADENDLVLADPGVSRFHCKLRGTSEGVRIVDLGSTNGTWVDGMRIKDGYLQSDSLIRVGSSELRFSIVEHGTIEVPLSPRTAFGGLLGKSPKMRHVFAVLERVAPTDATVLLEGETGTGKELAAEAVHDASNRTQGPFVVFDCSAVAAQLLDSELFGHVKGAFTGAINDRAGAAEEANGGTLFLDEVGELPPDLQPKLLRLLEKREVRRVGSNAPRKVDVRVIAATHRDLEALVNEGRFRADLFYRLAVVQVGLPALREHREDIPLYVEHFVNAISHGGMRRELLPGIATKLINDPWPGNVRQLRNAVERAVALSGGEDWSSDAETPLDVLIDLDVPLVEGRRKLLERFEKLYVTEALRASGGNVTRAAEASGVSRRFLQRMIQRLGLRAGDDET